PIRTSPYSSTPFPYTTLFRSQKSRQFQVLDKTVLFLPGFCSLFSLSFTLLSYKILAALLYFFIYRSIFHKKFIYIRIDRPCGSKDRKSTRLNSSHVSISYAVF